MKKLIQTAFAVLLSCLVSSTGFSQKTIIRVTDTYFRHNPFNGAFSSFLNHLLNDTLLAEKSIIKRTDSTFFFFKGVYKKYNSFGLHPIRVEIRLAESEIVLAEQMPEKDTILLYQLLLYTKPGSNDASEVQKEFEKFTRKYRAGFSGMESKDILESKKMNGVIRNFFVDLSAIPPVTVAYIISDNSENVFAITIRLHVKENMAMLPQASDDADTQTQPKDDENQ